MKKIEITTEDGYVLSSYLFQALEPLEGTLIINSATGVRQQIYFAFAQYMADCGFTTLTYDYRGIGESKPKRMRGFEASMKDWGTKDFVAVTKYIRALEPDLPMHVVGHSVGALIIGMNPQSREFSRMVFVGTQKAFVGNLNLRTRLMGYLGFGVVQPLTTRLLGYFPAHRFGLGESLPAGSARNWRTLVLEKESTNLLMEPEQRTYAENLSQEVLVLRAQDDSWLTDRGVRSLLKETYPNLSPTFRLLKKTDSPQGEIGHINYFRSYNKTLWSQVEDFLTK